MKSTLIVLLSLFTFHSNIQAQTSNHLNLKKGLAVQGYDVVSYFNGKAIKGQSKYSSELQGATYYFINAESKAIFDKSPEKYTPQYGGYCAYAIASGDKVKIDPKTFKIIDNKLYLFYNFKGTNTLELWNKEEKTLLPKADTEWQKIINN